VKPSPALVVDTAISTCFGSRSDCVLVRGVTVSITTRVITASRWR
jgi:hypothetical protein